MPRIFEFPVLLIWAATGGLLAFLVGWFAWHLAMRGWPKNRSGDDR